MEPLYNDSNLDGPVCKAVRDFIFKLLLEQQIKTNIFHIIIVFHI